jgi:cysteine synthase B
MVEAAIADGTLTPGSARRFGGSGPAILDATSGNTGIAYAMIGAALGIDVTLCLPRNASEERHRLLQAYGAEIVETDPLTGSDGAIVMARAMAAGDTERPASDFVYLDQYSNDNNWGAHFRTTGPEIWRQTGGAITHFVTGLGTSGTFMGVGRFLREQENDGQTIELVSVEPSSPFHGLEGLKHMASAIVPPIYDPSLADRGLAMETERAHAMVKRLGSDLGLLVGISAGGNVAAALEIAQELKDGGESGVIVTVLCDGASRYLSDTFWDAG